MNGVIQSEIQKVIVKCLQHGMKDENSIYQQVLDTVPEALSNTETEFLVYDLIKILKEN